MLRMSVVINAVNLLFIIFSRHKLQPRGRALAMVNPSLSPKGCNTLGASLTHSWHKCKYFFQKRTKVVYNTENNKNTDMSVSFSFQEPVFICIMKQWKYCKVIIEVREVEVIKEKEVVKTAPQRKPFTSYLIFIFASIFLLLALYYLIRNQFRL